MLAVVLIPHVSSLKLPKNICSYLPVGHADSFALFAQSTEFKRLSLYALFRAKVNKVLVLGWWMTATVVSHHSVTVYSSSWSALFGKTMAD